jgi:hypothetical protein
LIISSGAFGTAEAVFQPLPPHSGQTAGPAWDDKVWDDEVWGDEVLIADALLAETLLAEILFTHTPSRRSQRY